MYSTGDEIIKINIPRNIDSKITINELYILNMGKNFSNKKQLILIIEIIIAIDKIHLKKNFGRHIL